jgi:endonuclease G, mitochondrial
MPFAGYLTKAEIDALTDAAVASNLLAISRLLLLEGLPGGFVGNLDIVAKPLDQFQLDLLAVNKVERMANGQVPIVVVLRNCATELRRRGRAEATVFEEVANRIDNASTGVLAMPAASSLPEVATNERIVGDDDTLAIAFFSAGLRVAQAVARLIVPKFVNGIQVTASNGGPWVQKGTAWLVAPGLALTNHHMVNARRDNEAAAALADLDLQATNAAVQFGVDHEGDPGTSVKVAKLGAMSTTLDYALLHLVDAPDLPIPRIAAARTVLDPTTRMSVNIVQHPRGDPKQVAFRNNLVTFADPDEIRYYTDTDFGSSGSPVCDDDWRIVALHRGALHAPGAKYQGKDEAYVNFGSQIQAVLESIAAADAAAAGAIAAAQQV